MRWMTWRARGVAVPPGPRVPVPRSRVPGPGSRVAVPPARSRRSPLPAPKRASRITTVAADHGTCPSSSFMRRVTTSGDFSRAIM